MRATYIVHVAILAIATESNRVAGVFEAEEVKSTHAALITRLYADSDGVVGLLVDDNVVAASQRKRLDEVAS